MFTLQIAIAVILQLYVLYRCIRKILTNKELNNIKKIIWICVCLFVPVLGVISFLIAMRKKSSDAAIMDMGNCLDENVRNGIFLGLFYTFEFIVLLFIHLNPNNIWIFAILTVCTAIMLVLFTYGERLNKFFRTMLPYALLLLITVAQYLSVTEDNGFILLIAVAVVVLEYPLKFSLACAGVQLAEFLLGAVLKISITGSGFPPDYFVDFFLMNTFQYVVVTGAFYVAKRQLLMSNYLQYLMSELKSKTQELEEASALKERNRIAREIHDTLGHTLTGAIIQLEVAKQQLQTAPEMVEETIQKTQDITRQGFTEVKRAIKALRPILIEENTLDDGMQLLFERVKKNYDFTVNDTISLPDDISDELKVDVYRIVQELITNSMRHGHADRIDIIIEHQFDTLRINTKDNGKGCSLLKEGNGLHGIRERVEKMDGHVEFSSSENKGFGSIIYIPI